ncbi:hypothetical protein [Streptomyces fagopyri]|uniref:hypothetical protein n=1 Tax=Streptomyces fagopyri TaxID=2662397 RepID=UPI00380E319D
MRSAAPLARRARRRRVGPGAQARRETLDPAGLRHWQSKVLLMLRRSGPPYTASPSHLADPLGLTRAAPCRRGSPRWRTRD